ncbi:MAG: elongation factor G [Candidatus Mcinerneyibacterium aminivorans]|uniref:Elongation factor G n=1 Tax=Candidatus Mcinerneyibacterium aminivorans TaxID=2703815 RepID=A0A5D0MCV9_9BACT|nr:MAG: elongation factor G [Candidatus Mcinerneyibacterium aminivorans]
MSDKLKNLRNIVFAGQNGTGKTLMVESILKEAKVIDKKGSIEKGNTLSDYDNEEKNRKMSINLTTINFEWNDKIINLLDAPGYNDFINDSKSGIYAAEHVVSFVDAELGIQIGTERAWEDAQNMGKNISVFINKLDKENANFEEAFEEIKNNLDKPRPIIIQLPIGEGEDFKGIVDLVEMKAYESTGGEEKKVKIPSEIEDKVNEYRQKLMEAIAEEDEELMMKVLEGETLNDDEIKKGIKKGLQTKDIAPVFIGSAEKQIGIKAFMNFASKYFASPLEFKTYKLEDGTEITPDPEDKFLAKVYKTLIDPYTGKMSLVKVVSGSLKAGETVRLNNESTTERIAHIYVPQGKEVNEIPELKAGMIGVINKVDTIKTGETLTEKKDENKVQFFDPYEPVYSLAIKAKSTGNQDKLATGLNRLTEEDPYVKSWRNKDTKQSIISGLGDIHLDVMVSRLEDRFNVEVETFTPKVSYKETLAQSIKSHHRHKKQSGGRGQYGEVYMEFEPLQRGSGFEFVDKVVGGVIPSGFIPAVEKGIRNKMEEGVIAGYPVIDIRATVYDGSHHSVDSDEHSFKVAASKAFSKAFDKAGGVLLEPVLKVRIEVPKEDMGDVMGDLNSKRGRIQGMDPLKDGWQEIRAEVPESEMLRYAIDLRSITSGRGRFETEFAYYQKAPTEVQEEEIEKYQKEESESE